MSVTPESVQKIHAGLCVFEGCQNKTPFWSGCHEHNPLHEFLAAERMWSNPVNEHGVKWSIHPEQLKQTFQANPQKWLGINIANIDYLTKGEFQKAFTSHVERFEGLVLGPDPAVTGLFANVSPPCGGRLPEMIAQEVQTAAWTDGWNQGLFLLWCKEYFDELKNNNVVVKVEI